ncbi:hypothetical protein EGR_11222 [Echinococcus granulosus]|uniref:Uncharacterized protein n=1 Tax=Echinococcus granulosus TaxID=6210 RepID=W6U0E0_ECHGR|nr:hypothetical protein EGR_11222 [Echinococcus granulosus]EUB53921.1 hypothetical protein EGR_11222 [Echinococcus granulosus]
MRKSSTSCKVPEVHQCRIPFFIEPANANNSGTIVGLDFDKFYD